MFLSCLASDFFLTVLYAYPPSIPMSQPAHPRTKITSTENLLLSIPISSPPSAAPASSAHPHRVQRRFAASSLPVSMQLPPLCWPARTSARRASKKVQWPGQIPPLPQVLLPRQGDPCPWRSYWISPSRCLHKDEVDTYVLQAHRMNKIVPVILNTAAMTSTRKTTVYHHMHLLGKGFHHQSK